MKARSHLKTLFDCHSENNNLHDPKKSLFHDKWKSNNKQNYINMSHNPELELQRKIQQDKRDGTGECK
jgi:hypothetical protein